MNRAEHLQWCKTRALEYVDTGDLAQALASMTSDLGKHEDTQNSVSICVMGCSAVGNPDEMRKFINGFN